MCSFINVIMRMKRQNVVILIISIVLTILAFWHDYVYDVPSVPYTIGMHVVELLIMGPIFTGIFFMMIYGFYQLLCGLMRWSV